MIVGPCIVVTGGREPHVIEDGGVRVVGGHIGQIGPAALLAKSYPDETLWPARGRVLLPGLVNTHAHLARHLARGLSLRTAAEWRRYDEALSPEDVTWSVTAALAEGVRHGVTTVADFHRSGSCVDLSLSEVVGAATKVGVRVATCYGAAELDGEAERRAALEECLGFAGEIGRQRDGRVRALIGVQPATLDGVERMVVEALELAGDRLAVHADLALDLTPAERWRARSAWPTGGRPTLWAHAEAAPRGLLAEARDRGDHLSAVGAGNLTALLRDTELAWGSDAGVLAPPLPDTQQVWSFAASAEAHYQRLFVHGARWAESEFGEGIGAIEPGAPADLVLVDYRPATEFSQRTLLDHLWSGILRARVSGVMVAGEVVMDNGTLVHVDEQEVAARAREAAARVWGRL